MTNDKDTGLKWLNLDAIHQRLNIDFNCEDADLLQMGMASEESIINLTRRTYENFIDTYGRIPDPIFTASLLIVGEQYKNREAGTERSTQEIAFSFRFHIASYMCLTGGTLLQVERDGLLDKLTNVQTEFDFDFGEISDPTDELIEAYDTQRRNMAALYNRYAFIQQPTTYICQKFREAIAKAKEDCDEIINRQNA